MKAWRPFQRFLLGLFKFFFLSIIFPYSGETQKERQRHRQREKQAPCWEPYVGLNSQTLASSSELKKKKLTISTRNTFSYCKIIQQKNYCKWHQSILQRILNYTIQCSSPCPVRVIVFYLTDHMLTFFTILINTLLIKLNFPPWEIVTTLYQILRFTKKKPYLLA